MAQRMGTSWSCRLIERVRAFRPEWELGPRSSGPKLWRRWVERHVQGCPHCRAEVESWNRILSRLRPERPATAPPRVLDEVMARIALERAVGSARPERAAHLMAPTRRRRLRSEGRLQPGWDPLEQVLFWAAWAFLSGWAGAAPLLGRFATTIVRWELWPVLFEGWARMWRIGSSALSMSVGALPSELQPYVVAGLWCSVGFSVAILSALFTVRLIER